MQHSSASAAASNGTGPSESADDDLPSVMTCANYLKLPPYSTKVWLVRLNFHDYLYTIFTMILFISSFLIDDCCCLNRKLCIRNCYTQSAKGKDLSIYHELARLTKTDLCIFLNNTIWVNFLTCDYFLCFKVAYYFFAQIMAPLHCSSILVALARSVTYFNGGPTVQTLRL